jgi:hypothetical protein
MKHIIVEFSGLLTDCRTGSGTVLRTRTEYEL